MIAVVERGNDETFLMPTALSKLVQDLVCKRLGVLVRPSPAVDMEEHDCVLGLLGGEFADTVKVHMESSNIESRLAGFRGAVRQCSKHLVWARHGAGVKVSSWIW